MCNAEHKITLISFFPFYMQEECSILYGAAAVYLTTVSINEPLSFYMSYETVALATLLEAHNIHEHLGGGGSGDIPHVCHNRRYGQVTACAHLKQNLAFYNYSKL